MEFLNTLWVIAAAILAGRAYFRTRALAANVVALDARIARLELRFSGLYIQRTIAPVGPLVDSAVLLQPFSASEP